MGINFVLTSSLLYKESGAPVDVSEFADLAQAFMVMENKTSQDLSGYSK